MGMHPPAEQLIRDYLNRLSVAARGTLGFTERQSLLDRTRARIDAECGGINGASAVEVRKALANLGDPIVLVELEASQAGCGKSAPDTRYELPVAGNGNREMADEQTHATGLVKGSEIGEDLLVTGGPNGSKPGRGGGSIRSLLAGFATAQRRRRRASVLGEPVARAASRGGSGGGRGGNSAGSGPGGASGARPGGRPGPERRKSGLIPSPRRPAASEGGRSPGRIAGPQPSGGSSPSGSGPDRARGKSAAPAPADAGIPGRLIRRAGDATRNRTLEILAIVLLGVGGAVFPPIWLAGAVLALPSKKWDIRDKFLGITLPVVLLIVGTVLIIVFGGPHAQISDYAYEAWLGAGRLSRALAVAGALYLAWGLRRGRRQPKQPPWNVPRRPR